MKKIFIFILVFVVVSCQNELKNTQNLSEYSATIKRNKMLEIIDNLGAQETINLLPVIGNEQRYNETDLEIWEKQIIEVIAFQKIARESQIEAEKVRPIFIDMCDAIKASKSQAEADSVALFYSQWITVSTSDGTTIYPSKSPESYYTEYKNRKN